MSARLVRLDAPAYWSRWSVLGADGLPLGVVERRGGFAAWSVLDADGAYVGGARTRAEAVARLSP